MIHYHLQLKTYATLLVRLKKPNKKKLNIVYANKLEINYGMRAILIESIMIRYIVISICVSIEKTFTIKLLYIYKIVTYQLTMKHLYFQ